MLPVFKALPDRKPTLRPPLSCSLPLLTIRIFEVPGISHFILVCFILVKSSPFAP